MRLKDELRDQYAAQVRLKRQMKLRARLEEQNEEKKRIEAAHMSLDRERADKRLQRQKYQQELKFQSGQKEAERENQRYRKQMELQNQLKDIEYYVQKETKNEQYYRQRFDDSNNMMNLNAGNYVSSLDREVRQRTSSAHPINHGASDFH